MLRQVLRQAVWMVFASGLAAPAAGYLPQVGPPALRFTPPRAARALVAVELPPLAMSDRSETVDTTVSDRDGSPAPASAMPPAVAFPETAAGTLDSGASSSIPMPSGSAVASPVGVPGVPGAGVPVALTPQVLIPFFSGSGTSGAGVPTVVAPMSFLPPEASTGARSRATYTTSPP